MGFSLSRERASAALYHRSHDGRSRSPRWLCGPVPDLVPLLQLVAHALLQAVEDVRRTVDPLAEESEAEPGSPPAQAAALAQAFEQQVHLALAQLRATPESTLLEARGVGRLALPSTVIGLLFHAAEHTQRHVGQIITTARIVRGLGAE